MKPEHDIICDRVVPFVIVKFREDGRRNLDSATFESDPTPTPNQAVLGQAALVRDKSSGRDYYLFDIATPNKKGAKQKHQSAASHSDRRAVNELVKTLSNDLGVPRSRLACATHQQKSAILLPVEHIRHPCLKSHNSTFIKQLLSFFEKTLKNKPPLLVDLISRHNNGLDELARPEDTPLDVFDTSFDDSEPPRECAEPQPDENTLVETVKGNNALPKVDFQSLVDMSVHVAAMVLEDRVEKRQQQIRARYAKEGSMKAENALATELRAAKEDCVTKFRNDDDENEIRALFATGHFSDNPLIQFFAAKVLEFAAYRALVQTRNHHEKESAVYRRICQKLASM